MTNNKMDKATRLVSLRASGKSWKEIGEALEENGENLRKWYSRNKEALLASRLPEPFAEAYETSLQHSEGASSDIDPLIVAELQERVYRQSKIAQGARRQLKAYLESHSHRAALEEKLAATIKSLPDVVRTHDESDRSAYRSTRTDVPLTLELLLGDLQIGKLSPEYNSKIAEERLKAYTGAVLARIDQYFTLGYRIERIVIAFLGDLIESSEKHEDSGTATDFSTPSQIQMAIEGLFSHVLLPLSDLRIPIEAHCVVGNHDHDGRGLKMYAPGRESFSHVIYSTLKLLCEKLKLDIKFVIPEGSYSICEIYGHSVLYEHGVGVPASESGMRNHVAARARQQEAHITYFRMGDKHNVCRFCNDTYVVNGAFFGSDKGGVEYSSIKGYASKASQILFAHTPRQDERLPLYDSFVIQLQHVR